MKKSDLEILSHLYESVYSEESGNFLTEESDYIEDQRLSGPQRRQQQAQARTNRPVGAGVGRGQGGRSIGSTTRRGGAAPKPTTPTPKPTTPAASKSKLTTTPAASKSKPTTTPAASKPATAKPATSSSLSKSQPSSTQNRDSTVRSTYDKLRKTNPSAAAKYGMAASRQKFGDTSKPKTSNPLMNKTSGQSALKKTTPTPNVSGMKSGRLATAISRPNKKIGEGYDAYDIVLNYIIENGHAESLDEAHYIMMEMSPELIRDIVAESKEEFEVLEHLVSEGYADTKEAACEIMENMSKEWKETIINDSID